MNTDPAPRDPAQARYLVLTLLRLSGVALIVVGLLVINRRIDLPEMAGYAFLAVGVADALVMPVMLARRWKSPS
jgi:hypothetical protein